MLPGNGTYASFITVTNTGTVTPAPGSSYKDGVQFSAPGYLLNQGSITGASGGAAATSGYGVLAFNGPTIVNAVSGTITGGSGSFGGYGVYLKKGASLSNAGSIAGGYGRYNAGTGVKVGSASYGGYLLNTGTITGGAGKYTGGYGVALIAGTIVNTGLITGGGGPAGGTGVYLGSGTSFTNAGAIAGGAGSALGGTGVAANYATFTNAASGIISGGKLSRTGLDQTGGTSTNFGTITAGLTNGAGVFLHRGGSFTNASGGVITGGISSGPTGGNGLYISGALSSAYNAGTITGGAGGTSGGNGAYVYFYASLTNGITGTITGGTGTYGGTGVFLNGATLTNSGLIAGGTGTLRNGAAIAFEGAGSTLIEAAAATLAGTITGFAPGDTIIAAGFVATGDNFIPGTGLILSGNAGSETFGLTGNLAAPEFALSTDGTNSTITFIPSIDAQFDYSGSIVTETIALTGLYDIEAQGAQGGSSHLFGESGGDGAILDATFALTAGNVIELLVAGAGANGNGAGGGGGATFIYDETTGILLEAAGGGGGAGAGYNGVNANGYNAVAGPAGSGGGGAAGTNAGNADGGGGGGGFSGNGATFNSSGGGFSFRNGGAGGSGAYPGGFGGGGGASGSGGGGGGGYSGGNGGTHTGNYGKGGGGGGTSYIYQGASHASFNAINTGNGFAGIKLVSYSTAGPTPALISIISSTVFNTVNTGNGTYATAITITNAGTIAVAGTAIANEGSAPLTLSLEPGALIEGAVIDPTGKGTLILGAGAFGSSDIGTSFSGFSAIDFAATASWSLEGDVGKFDSGETITGFSFGDTIILDHFVVNTLDTTYVSGTGLELTDTAGNHITLDIAGNFSTSSFIVIDPPGTTTIEAVCYLRGTRIATPSGERAIESLAAGDAVVTKFGGYQRIKWIGRQSYDRRFIAHNYEQIPVRICKGALGGGLPRRDLFVSPGHSMLIDGVLVLAKALVNGITIRQDDCPAQVDYFQLEFEAHDCILAEGAWSESYADTPDWRDKFHNAAEFYALFPDHVAPAAQQLCADRPLAGPALARALRPVVTQAGFSARPGRLSGFVDQAAGGLVRGWAQDQAHPLLPVQLEIWADGKMAGHVLACEDRADLLEAGIGRGRCGFAFTLPAGCDARDITVRRASDGAALPMGERAKAA